jgi:hypothetical protein
MAGAFDALGIPYALGGSLASSLFGEPRSTVDVDIAVRLDDERCDRLVGRLGAEFYVPTDAARAAVAEHASFNLLDRESGLKVDLFVLGDGPLDAMQMARRIQVMLPEIDRPIWVTSPEVQVLRKLDWYVRGGRASDRQWRDVVSILRITTELDISFLTAAAGRLGLDALLTQALDQARA